MKLKMYLQYSIAQVLDTWRLNRLKAEFNNAWKQLRSSDEKELTMIYAIPGEFEDDIVHLLDGTAIRVIREKTSHAAEVCFGTIGPSVMRLDGEAFRASQPPNDRWVRCAMNGDYWLTNSDLGLTIALEIHPEASTKIMLKSSVTTPLCQRQPGQHLAVLVAIKLLEVILDYWDNLPEEEDEKESERPGPTAARQARDDHHGGQNGQPVGWRERVKGSSYDTRD